MRLQNKLQSVMIVIVFMLIYYSFLMGFMINIKDSIIGVMSSHNLTSIEIPQKVYNETSGTWEKKTTVFDLSGFVDIVFTLVIVFAPLLVSIKIIW